LREKILGIAAIYPPIDLKEGGEAKMARRPDPGVPDFIGESYAKIERLYLDDEDRPSLEDPRVSPAFFEGRESLPSRVLMIGAEHCMFCYEDEAMAEKLAAMGDGAKVETEDGWKAAGVQWYKISDQPHAFDAFVAKTAEAEVARLAAVDAMFAAISEWLVEVFAKGAGN
jgi:acetyl esterase/lipase